jgi:hypothetical protein
MIWLEKECGDVLRYLTVINLAGTQKIVQADRIVSFPEGATAFSLVLNSRESKNSFTLTDAYVELIGVTPHYYASRLLLFCCWFAFFLIRAIWLYQHGSRPLFAGYCK